MSSSRVTRSSIKTSDRERVTASYIPIGHIQSRLTM